MRTSKTKNTGAGIAAGAAVLYIPQPRMTLSQYAKMTGQSLRAVQQQADAGKFILAKDKYGKEREINMIAEYLKEQAAAEEALRMIV